MNDFDYEVLVDTICVALDQPHRGECNRIAQAVAPQIDRMYRETVQEVVDAWTIPGRVPRYHLQMQSELEKKWPVLARAVRRMVKHYDQR